MRRRHFETLRPVCPVCRAAGADGFPLRIATVAREADGHLVEGVLHCTNANCQREFPVIDGVPLLVANIRQYVADNALAICGRRDLSELIETVIGDCCGPGSAFDTTRQHLSSYAWDHYADLDPAEPVAEPRPGSMLRSLETGKQLAGPLAPGPVLDAGCSVGRGTFALAEQGDELVLGVDMNFAMLRLAGEVLRGGRVRYPRRRVGLVYETREFPAEFARRENVDFWACDATALPFPDGTFSLATALNVLDCVSTPRELLASFGRALKPGGKAVLACPYDWSVAATPLEGWLGGHSQRSPLAGSSAEMLRRLLRPGATPGSVNTLRLIAERDDLPWRVRLHERSTMTYRLHLVAAERVNEEDGGVVEGLKG
ncbi:MAG: methyltransferase domain-containing protein [Verrucomicrobia bacterium]|nr:methyltransferase domain-containing protein [Verrucomicrobiota bacterium]